LRMPEPAGAGAPRLIELAPFDREEGGSFVPQLAAIFAEAASRGWRSEIVLPEAARAREWVADLQSSGTTIHFAPPVGRLSRPGWLSSLVGDDDARTVLHSHFTTWDLAAASVASRSSRRQAYWHVHTVLARDPVSLSRNIAKFTLFGRRVDGVFCPAVNIADALRRRGIPADQLRVIPSGIDPESFPLLDDDARRAARESLGLPEGSTVLLHFGWDWRIKGGDLFMLATEELLRRDGEDLIALAQRGGKQATEAARRLGIEDHVRVIGTVPDVRDLFGAADIFLAVSKSEGMPYSVLECVCSGTPVIASDLPGHAVVAEAVPACTLVPRNATDIADAVQAILGKGAETRESEAHFSREWVTENFSAERSAELILDTFEGRA
jgi:glycosyltransferase involved in cell wall biosynthesis